MAGLVGAWLLVPADDGVVPAVADGAVGGPGGPGGAEPVGGRRLPRRAVPLLGAILALSFSTQCVIVVSGAWLEDVAGLSPGLIGVAVVVLAISELAGTAGAAVLNDRIGKARCVLLGGIVEAAGLVALIVGGENVAVGFIAFAVVICGFEHALISTFPLVSELSVSRRATGVGAALAILTVSRSAGSVVGAATYDAAGIARPATIALALLLAGLLVTATAVRDPAAAPAS